MVPARFGIRTATTEVQRPDATHYVDYEEYVDFQLEKTRASIKLTMSSRR